MFALCYGEVVNQLMLPDLAALRIDIVPPAHGGEKPIVEAPCGRERFDGGGNIRGSENRRVVRSGQE